MQMNHTVNHTSQHFTCKEELYLAMELFNDNKLI